MKPDSEPVYKKWLCDLNNALNVLRTNNYDDTSIGYAEFIQRTYIKEYNKWLKEINQPVEDKQKAFLETSLEEIKKMRHIAKEQIEKTQSDSAEDKLQKDKEQEEFNQDLVDAIKDSIKKEQEDKLQKAIDWCDEKLSDYSTSLEFEHGQQMAFHEMKQYLESIK